MLNFSNQVQAGGSRRSPVTSLWSPAPIPEWAAQLPKPSRWRVPTLQLPITEEGA